jgi:hypothetical protein
LNIGYFDALTSSYFKITQDGRKLFFPWGIFGRGYVIASQDYKQLQHQVKIYTIVSPVLIIVAAALFQRLNVAVAIGVLLTMFYIVWAQYLTRDLQISNERLSLQDSMTSQARTHSTVGLWALEIIFAWVCLWALLLSLSNRTTGSSRSTRSPFSDCARRYLRAGSSFGGAREVRPTQNIDYLPAQACRVIALVPV